MFYNIVLAMMEPCIFINQAAVGVDVSVIGLLMFHFGMQL